MGSQWCMHEAATEGDKILEDRWVAIVETEGAPVGIVGLLPENLPLPHGSELEDSPLPILRPSQSKVDIVQNPQVELEEKSLQSFIVEHAGDIGAEN